jgi:hypothetical protein
VYSQFVCCTVDELRHMAQGKCAGIRVSCFAIVLVLPDTTCESSIGASAVPQSTLKALHVLYARIQCFSNLKL